jgi:hypothetical protein
MGVNVDRLVGPLNHQTRGQGLLPCAVLSYRCRERWRLSGDAKPLVLDIWWRVDHLDICATKLYMERIFT